MSLRFLFVVLCFLVAFSLPPSAAARGGSNTDRQERVDRQTRFERLDKREAVRLARREFPGKVVARGFEGSRLVSEGRVQRYLGDSAAVVDVPGEATPALVQSTLPLRARDASGRLAPLDLDLVDRAGRLRRATRWSGRGSVGRPATG